MRAQKIESLDYDNMEDTKRLVEKLGENEYKKYKL